MLYGDLLQNFTDAGVLPVFRTESEDRMVKSAVSLPSAHSPLAYPSCSVELCKWLLWRPGISRRSQYFANDRGCWVQ